MLCYAGSEESLELLSGLPEVEYWREWDCLALPVCRENLLALETLGRLQEATDDYVNVRARLLQAPARWVPYYPEPIPGQPPPFQHQIDTFCWALEAEREGFKGFATYAEMGTGKTRAVIDWLRFVQPQVAVIVVQNSTALQWGQNLARLWPEAEVSLLVGSPLAKRVAQIEAIREMDWDEFVVSHVLVVNWEALSRLVGPLYKLRPGVVVADEATRMKDRNSQMARAAFKLADASGFRIVMTGTPLGNSPGDLWSLYRFMDSSIFGKSYWAFARKYFRLGGFTGNEFASFDPQNIGEFISKVYSCAYRITKACISDMPEKLYEVIRVPMLPEQRKVYDQVKKDLYAIWATEEGQKTLTVANVLSQSIRLQQITAGLFPTDNPDEPPVRIRSAKTEWLLDYVRERVGSSDARLVIWTRYKGELEAICKGLLGSGFAADEFGAIDGSVNTKDREALRNRFNDRSSRLRILIAQVQAAAYGLDLPQADELIYHSNTYSYTDRAQSEDRGHRLGRTRSYNIIDLCAENSIDELILRALRRKENLADLLLMKGVAAADKIG